MLHILCSVCRRPVRLVFGLDTSQSIGWSRFALATSFAQTVALNLEPRSAVGLVTFSDVPRLVLNLTSVGSYSISDQMTSVYDGTPSTNTAGALRMMCSMLSPVSDVPLVGLIVVDGRSDDFAATVREADNCWNAGIQLIAVGVGGAVSGDMYAVQELKDVANPGNDQITDASGRQRPQRLFFVPDFASLANITSAVNDILCSSEYIFVSLISNGRSRSLGSYSVNLKSGFHHVRRLLFASL